MCIFTKHTLAGREVVDLTQCEEESKHPVELGAAGNGCVHNNISDAVERSESTAVECRTRGSVL